MLCGEQTFECFARVRRGQTSVEGCEHAGRSAAGRRDENAEKVCKIAIENRRSTNSETVGRLSVWYGTCRGILREDLNTRRISMGLGLRLFTDEQ
jgi:hypothetical protein